jgi:hypothetical protein
MLGVENWGEGRIIPGCWRQERAEGMQNATLLHSNNHRRNESDVQDKYAEMFCLSEVVPWQWMMIKVILHTQLVHRWDYVVMKCNSRDL